MALNRESIDSIAIPRLRVMGNLTPYPDIQPWQKLLDHYD